jgi:hypothetical protein
VATFTSFRCLCPVGMRLDFSDDHRRTANDSPFLLYSQLSQIYGIDLNANASTNGRTKAFQPVIVDGLVVDFDFDSRDGFVYWIEHPSIDRMHPNPNGFNISS